MMHSSSSPTIQTLLSTSQVPPSSENVPEVTSCSIRTRHQSSTTERSTDPACIFSKASSIWSIAIRSVTKASRSSLPCWYRLDQHREVAGGQAVAVPGGLQRPAAAKHVQQRQFQGHLRGGHAHQDHGAGQVAGVESLLVGFRTADGVDHHVRAEAAGQLPDRLDGVGGGGVDGVRGAEGAGRGRASWRRCQRRSPSWRRPARHRRWRLCPLRRSRSRPPNLRAGPRRC